MLKTLILVSLSALAVPLSLDAPGTGQDPQDPTPASALEPGKMDPALLKKLAWVCGTWRQEDGDIIVEEHWRPLKGTTILGTSHTYDGEQSHFFEFLRISHRAGSISYIPMPGGGPPTLFRLVRLEDGLMVFENPKHDHPQRISYMRTEEGMTAMISQLDGSRASSWDFVKKD